MAGHFQIGGNIARRPDLGLLQPRQVFLRGKGCDVYTGDTNANTELMGFLQNLKMLLYSFQRTHFHTIPRFSNLITGTGSVPDTDWSRCNQGGAQAAVRVWQRKGIYCWLGKWEGEGVLSTSG